MSVNSIQKACALMVLILAVGQARAGVADGIDLFKRGQYKEARSQLEPEAERGNFDAMAYVGEMYLKGLGGGRNELAARNYTLKAANEGKNSRAIFNLGLMYLSGNLVEKDETKGVDLIQKSAEARHPPGQALLAVLLFRGQHGYARDPQAALAWFKAAAEQKDPAAMYWLGLYHEYGHGNVQKDSLVALDWYRRSAELKYPDANVAVGRIYLDGIGVLRDIPEGLRWMRRAAVLGSFRAYLTLGSTYESGSSGFARDPALALGWFSMLPSQAPPDAQRTAREATERIAKLFTPAEYADLEKRGKAQASQSLVMGLTELASSAAQQARKGVFGSGVLVGKTGEIVTNEHVIQGCERVRVNPMQLDVKVVSRDAKNDLALLKSEGLLNTIPAPLRAGRGIRSGDEVIAVGYPLKGMLSSGPIVTNGIVNALSGASNDTSNFQFSATVQPGSSGGGVWDRDGNLVGVVKARYLSTGEANVQNVNFGINLATLIGFLDNNNVDYPARSSSTGKLSITAVSELAGKSVLQVECY